jgi:hypothetical protein
VCKDWKTYWIDSRDGYPRLCFSNTDTERDVAFAPAGGYFRTLRCRLWGLRQGCGWVSLRP